MSVFCTNDRFASLITAPEVSQQLQKRLEDLVSRSRQSHAENHRLYSFPLDVPITMADVERWGQRLGDSAPPPATPNAAFVGGGFTDPAAVIFMGEAVDRERAVHKLAPMKLFDPRQVDRTPMTKILIHRRTWLPYRQRLPVYQCRGPILNALRSSQVLALVAPPGSGRTLQMPQIISETEIFKSKRLIVVCSTSLSACRTAERLREERGDAATSNTVALCTPTRYEVAEGTLIAVTTPEMLVRQLLCDPLLLNVVCIILNDVHLRSPTTELCMSLLRSTLQVLKEEQGVKKRGGPLHVVADCFEDAIATTVTEFFGKECTARLNVSQVLQQDLKAFGTEAQHVSQMWSPPSVLLLEETMQWLAKCEEEGSCICRDTGEDLRNYVENISVAAKIMAAEEAEFTNNEKLRSYWCPIIVQAVKHYDRAERKELLRNAEQQKQQQEQQQRHLPSVVVIVPNVYIASVVEEALRRAISDSTVNLEEACPLPFSLHLLLDGVTTQDVDDVLRFGDAAKREGKRMVLLTTPTTAHSVLPPTWEIGLVVDCARRSYAAYDDSTGADVFITTYSLVQELRYRRVIARLRRSESSTGEQDATHPPVCMVVQLIPKSILYGAKHRHISVDHGHHPIFNLSWDEYVDLYHLLQAREEGLRCREVGTVTPNSGTNYILSSMVANLVPLNFIGVPTASTSRYEKLRRTFATVERHLRRLGHLVCTTVDSAPRLSPLGVAATCFAWPIEVVRLLLFARLDDCVLPASVVAAAWMVGNMFFDAAADKETEELMKEARVYFSLDSGSDVVSVFNAYHTWLCSRKVSNEACDAFLDETLLSNRALMQIEAQQLALLRVLEATGVFGLPLTSKQSCSNENEEAVPAKNTTATDVTKVRTTTTTTIDADTVASHILEIPVEDLREGEMIFRCVTAAVYPSCAIPHSDGVVSTIGFADKISSTVSDPSASPTRTTVHPAIFSPRSVMSVEKIYQLHAEQPFLYLDRTRVVDKGFYVLEEAIPLSKDAAVIVCGDWHEWPKSPATRCRGWTSILTQAWRQTKLARSLPPPAQLPAISVKLRLYDTVRAKSVLVQTDDTFFFSMRSTTAQWLQQMRDQSRRRLRALLCDKSWPARSDASLGLKEAWEWWSRRGRGAQDWLREERASRTVANNDVGNRVETLLCPYYQYSSNPGRPTAVVPSKNHIGSALTSSFAAASSSAAAAGSGSVVLDAASDAAGRQPSAYVGKLPEPVMDKNIQHVAQSIAKARSREQEATFLKMYPDLFAFLHPEHEFHGYYLHVLRRVGPELEILGDDLEELEIFLKELEEEVQREVGITATDALPSCEAQPHNAVFAASEPNGNAQYQFQEVNAEEYMASYGMQVETAAEHARRPPTLFKIHDGPVSGPTAMEGANTATSVLGAIGEEAPTASSFFNQPMMSANVVSSAVPQDGPAKNETVRKPIQVDPNAFIGNFTFDRGPKTETPAFDGNKAGEGNGEVGGAGGGLTLMERLLAMKGGTSASVDHAAAPASSSAPEEKVSLQIPAAQAAPSVSVGLWPATTLPPPSLASNLTNAASASAVGVPVGAAQQEVPVAAGAAPNAPTAAELLALMGILTPPPAVNPLTIPPPPLPAEVVANRSPSILAYPLPSREFGNIHLILAKALGETMGVKVGPTHIVGAIARIDVPNHKVEARALDLKSFMCVGRKVNIFKNDRIIDGVRPPVQKAQPEKSTLREDVPGQPHKADYDPEGAENENGNDVGMNNAKLPLQERTNEGGPVFSHYSHYLPQNEQREHPSDETLMPKKSLHPPQIGLLTDSEDCEDSSSSVHSSEAVAS
ncbi:putative RNA helicase [Trypanosoma rangeli]|uniref:Putative RNA helicase n=1 Tax=Trypanosoma rangeli TaxID=5698 RepID=A0A422NMY1_TRYRA|nr:putative RNA helicase [Trypanosoma rangeli]RNF06825.1 putative RNA helicase [Trypanosoma rangeli]|eukprot:RNF06825.1 putative RNA helicase [Trypanosoma rangeli]